MPFKKVKIILFKKEFDIINEIIDNKFSFEFKGHDIYLEYTKEELKKITSIISDLSMKHEKEMRDKTLIRNYKRNGFLTPEDFDNDLNEEIEKVRSLIKATSNTEFKLNISTSCYYCGEKIVELLVDTLNKSCSFSCFETLFEPEFIMNGDKVIGIKKEGEYIVSELKQCTFPKIDYFSSIINVKDNLQFVNFFKNEDGTMFDKVHNINYLYGQKELWEDYASKDILCGQTGDFVAYIYEKNGVLHLLKSEVDYVLGEMDIEFFEDESKYQPLVDFYFQYKDWDFKGSISFEMRRIMATSTSNAEKLNLKEDHYTDGGIIVPLKSGKYGIKYHYSMNISSELIAEISPL